MSGWLPRLADAVWLVPALPLLAGLCNGARVLLGRTGGNEVMATRLARAMKREDYVLVLA